MMWPLLNPDQHRALNGAQWSCDCGAVCRPDLPCWCCQRGIPAALARVIAAHPGCTPDTCVTIAAIQADTC